MSELSPGQYHDENLSHVDPNQISETSDLEHLIATDEEISVATEMQEDVHHDVSDQVTEDPRSYDPDINDRIEGLRSRGRVGVLTEGTERPDISGRIINSDHDPEAIATVNKANRLTRQKRAEYEIEMGGEAPKNAIGRNYKLATERKLNEVVSGTASGESPLLKEYFDDSESWEANLRERLQDEGESDQRIEREIEWARKSNDRKLEEIGERWDRNRDNWIESELRSLMREKADQEQYRGDLLSLYAKDPEKYKAMTTEEFVAEGHEYRSSGQETAKLANLESLGKLLEQKLPEFVEEATSIHDFCMNMNKAVVSLKQLAETYQISREELFSILEAVEGKEVPGLDTLPKESKTPEQKEATRAYELGQDVRRDTERNLNNIHGYFSAANFTLDLERSPREQMREAVERIKPFTSKWISDGQRAREEFEKRWGKVSKDKEPV